MGRGGRRRHESTRTRDENPGRTAPTTTATPLITRAPPISRLPRKPKTTKGTRGAANRRSGPDYLLSRPCRRRARIATILADSWHCRRAPHMARPARALPYGAIHTGIIVTRHKSHGACAAAERQLHRRPHGCKTEGRCITRSRAAAARRRRRGRCVQARTSHTPSGGRATRSGSTKAPREARHS